MLPFNTGGSQAGSTLSFMIFPLKCSAPYIFAKLRKIVLLKRRQRANPLGKHHALFPL